ncbi:MAG: hypothetical protein CR993_00585 [Rhodobacterales bacterium]|nr:MAG: hypothetical protein CR993_00585 [Rhodobacterales bacterium]
MRLFALLVALLIATPARAEPLIGMSFPPVTTAQHRAFTARALKNLGIRHIRISENWKLRGVSPGPQDFAPLVERLDDLNAAGLKILLTIPSDGPRAVCVRQGTHGCAIAADAPFEAYLKPLFQAVRGRVEAVQFGNEWETQFPGSAAEFIALTNRFYAAAKQHAPGLPVVLGGITGTVPYYHAYCIEKRDPNVPKLDAAGVQQALCAKPPRAEQARVEAVFARAKYDIADLHLYDAPGLWRAAYDWTRARARAPVWITEFGGPNPRFEPSGPAYLAQRIPIYLAAMRRLPAPRAYYFKLTDDPASYHSQSGLYTRTGQPKDSLAAFRAALR